MQRLCYSVDHCVNLALAPVSFNRQSISRFCLQICECVLGFEEKVKEMPAEVLAACERSVAYWERNQIELADLCNSVNNGTFRLPAVQKSAEAIAEQWVVKEKIGYWGEAYVFLALQLVLPGFNSDCWVAAGKQ